MEEAHRLRRVLLAGAIVVGLVLSGCAARPRVRFVGDDRVYTLAQVAENAATLKPGPAASVDVAQASEVRQRVLADLRGSGALASQAADFLTRQFPPVTKAVPYYVEAARVDGRRCWVIVESWGGKTGKLGFRRLWVFDRDDGSVIDSRVYR